VEEEEAVDGDGDENENEEKETGDGIENGDGEAMELDEEEKESGDGEEDENGDFADDEDEDFERTATRRDGHIHKRQPSVHVQIEQETMEERQSAVLELLASAANPTYDQEDFMEQYQERFDKFVSVDDTVPLYRSTKHDLSALFDAILRNDFQHIIDLIDRDGVDPNMPTIDGTTPLHFACEHSGALVIKFLMDRGANPFKIQSGKMYPRDMMELNMDLSADERLFMQRLLDVKDVRYDPFALTDERVYEIQRIQLFLRLFVRYGVMLFAIWLGCFGSTAMLTNYFGLDYKAPL